MAEDFTTNSYVVLSTPSHNEMTSLKTAQVLADDGDTLRVVAVGETHARTVSRESLKSYKSVYGTDVPGRADRPIVRQIP